MASPDRVNILAIERYFPRIPSSLKIGKEISRGSYGTVHEGQVNDRPVAVKRIHRILLEPPCNEGTSILLDKFQQECSLLEEADNVHVVQFYGTYYDEESQELILVMEKLQQTLIEYLSANRGNLSLQRQVEICLEIVNGVHFLHSLVPPVIHLDLNDKNVMLTEEGLVKVGDLGQSCLKEGNIDYFTTAQPGAIQFMPPEALQEAAHYDEKIDTFSIGVLMLEIATQQSPQVRLLGIGVVPEVKRRAKDFSKLGENHPLKPIIINCLRIDPTQRPNTGALQRKLQTLIEKLQTGSEAIVPQEVTPSPANEEQLLETQDSWEPGTIVVAKHKFATPVPTELPFEKGDRLTILSVSRDPNWYKARAEDGTEGMIPANYVAKPQPPPLPIRMRPHRQVTLPVPPPRMTGMSKRSTINREASFRRICSSSDAAQLRKMSWFHGKISRSEVKAKMNPKRDGLFLIRECQTYPGDYALSLCFNEKIEQYRIHFKGNTYTIDDEDTFVDLSELVEHYQQDADGLVSRLITPVEKEGKSKSVITVMEVDDLMKSAWSIPKEKLKIGAKIRDGALHEVFCGEYQKMKVEIKCNKDGRSGDQNMLKEASVMMLLNHPNLVHLIGVSVDQKPFHIITELMEKRSLLEYLQSRKRSDIQKSHQIGFIQDIVSGMVYLEQKNLVHRDLAARSVLISGENIAKVANFQLTSEGDSHQKGLVVAIKWTAPEAIESGDFSNKSDVWSFGVVIWEVYSYGRVPYPSVPTDDVHINLKSGYRLQAPNDCPPAISAIMLACWHQQPGSRPAFSQLKEKLKSLPPSACDPDGFKCDIKCLYKGSSTCV